MGIVFAIVVVLGLSLGALLKGRVWLGILGLVFPPLAFVGVVRLARPTSPWARWRYPRRQPADAPGNRAVRAPGPRYRRWQDRIAGAPSVIAAPGRPSAEPGHGDGDAGAGVAAEVDSDAGAPRPEESVDVSAG